MTDSSMSNLYYSSLIYISSKTRQFQFQDTYSSSSRHNSFRSKDASRQSSQVVGVPWPWDGIQDTALEFLVRWERRDSAQAWLSQKSGKKGGDFLLKYFRTLLICDVFINSSGMKQ